MYHLKRFLDDRFSRVNSILDSFSNLMNNSINLVASSSYPYPEVTEVMKYPLSIYPTEGFPGQRYFPSYEFMDDIEIYGEQLAKQLFKLDDDYKVNLQPHSGTQANHIVYNGILDKNDIVLSLSASDGGHISHTMVRNKIKKLVYYKLTNDGRIDYNEIETKIKVYHPKLVIAGTSSYPREIDFKRISELALKYGSYVLADISHTAIFIAEGIHKTIFPYVHFATFTLEKNMRGPHGGILIYKSDFSKKINYSTFPSTQGGPIQTILLAKVVCFQKLLENSNGDYGREILKNGRLLAEHLQKLGIQIFTKGTDSHILLVDLRSLNLSGVEAEKRLEEVGVLANRNLLPNDQRSPLITSGLRLGVACITNLGYKPDDIIELAKIIAKVLKKQKIDRTTITRLINKYPILPNNANSGTD